MQSTATRGDVLVDNRSDAVQPDAASQAALSENDVDVDSYFDLRAGVPDSPSSVRSHPLSMVEHSNTIAPAFAALQYLPIPLIVLSSQKTVILANEALGRLLNINLMNCPNETKRGNEDALSVTDILHGYSISQLGIDLLQGGSPILGTWEVR